MARQEVRKHMNLYRYREAWMISLRVFQLYQARGVSHLNQAQHITCAVLHRMYASDFSEVLLKEARELHQ